MRRAVLILAVLAASPAVAEEQPTATAQATAPGASVSDQIAEYLRTSPAAAIEDDGVPGVTPRDERRIHGEVSVGVGTGGYRSLYLRSEMPVGESGRVGIAVEDTRYGRGYAPWPAYGFGGGRVMGAFREPQRCDLEGLTSPRPLDAVGGPNGHCVGRRP